MPQDLAAALEVARRDLLDLGLRNTLLNYRPLRSKGAEVIDESPREVFRILVTEEKKIVFLPANARGSLADANDSTEDQLAQPDEDSVVDARLDTRLQTSYSSTQLQTRLLATYHAARTSIEEQGVNTLYLALGMLCWREADTSETVYRAPLILIPVELERSDARHRFHLKYTGEEIGGNVSLAEKLKQSFGIRDFPEVPEPDDLDIDDYFRNAQRAIRSRNGWSVDSDAIALGFFSFAKFLMYRDLDSTTWPAADAILSHEILQSLLTEHSFEVSPSNYSDDSLLDDQLQDRQVLHVVDSDSTQTIAILDCLDGHNMVIQGPPGTGKSQTIVNLIAGAIADGKRVLFVSEKMAALDVVKRRLDRVHLGAACLELHSNRTNKRTIIAELRRTALGDRLANPQPQTDLSLLQDARDRLNAYCKAVNEPIAASGENPCSAYGKLLAAEAALRGSDFPAAKVEAIADWTADQAVRRRHLVAQLQDRVARTGVPVKHPFWGSQLVVLLPTDRDEIRNTAVDAMAACTALDTVAASLARMFSVDRPTTEQATKVFGQSTSRVFSAPDLAGVNLGSPAWLAQEGRIRQVLAAGSQYSKLHGQYDSLLRPKAWDTDTAETRQSLAELGGRWWRFLSGRWRRARVHLRALCMTVPPKDQASQLALLDAISGSVHCAEVITLADGSMKALFSLSWNGKDSDWDLLESQADWIINAKKGVHEGTLEPWCVEPEHIAIDRNAAASLIRSFDLAQEAYSTAFRVWADRLRIDEARFFDGPLASQSFSTLGSRWRAQSDHVEQLHSLVAFNQISAECQAERLESIVSVATTWDAAATLLIPLYERVRLTALLERAFNERGALASFDGARHSNTVSQFRRLDLLQMEYNRAFLAAKCSQALPAGGGAGEIGVLWHEFEKRSRFLPIRSLMLKAGHAIQSIKPVFMMSPLSIANYLPPGSLTFELVIFDEASQVRPVDALGAIVRGKQVVVVGDSKQLPPTSFFDSVVESDEGEADDEVTTASDIESVLGLFCSRGAHQRMLRWHYRSRHESLISVSNHLFYDDRLVVFPSPERDNKSLGLVYRRVQNAPYERSRTRTNPVEAKTVAAAVMTHAHRQLQLPREQWETLGVAAFSVAQMDAILNQLELSRRRDPRCEEFFTFFPHEPFFVKNLENVQGDERDVIFISVGYGRTAEGYLAMSFGPLNRTGGERRLNVLISRARKRCEVFTTLCADDVDLSRTSSAGAAALKTFLNYAQTGQMEVPVETGRAPDSDFEEQVLRQLTVLGYDVRAQVGCAGFFLDLAVVDPSQPGRYLLGIECDGARYHSAKSARDRDRLRQVVLKDLGWKIHRIWSTDWFHNPEEELRKVVQAIETAKTTTSDPPPAPKHSVEIDQRTLPSQTILEPSQKQRILVVPYECARIQLRLGSVDMHMVDRTQLADILAQVVNVESPVHWLEAARRVLDAAGVQRLGNRIQQAFEQAMRRGVSRELFIRRGDFLWLASMKEPPVRDRGDLPMASRKFAFVPPEEIRRAILIVVEESYGILPSEVPNAVCRMFGFARVTDDMSAAVEPHCDALRQEGLLLLQGVNFVLAQSRQA